MVSSALTFWILFFLWMYSFKFSFRCAVVVFWCTRSFSVYMDNEPFVRKFWLRLVTSDFQGLPFGWSVYFGVDFIFGFVCFWVVWLLWVFFLCFCVILCWFSEFLPFFFFFNFCCLKTRCFLEYFYRACWPFDFVVMGIWRSEKRISIGFRDYFSSLY